MTVDTRSTQYSTLNVPRDTEMEENQQQRALPPPTIPEMHTNTEVMVVEPEDHQTPTTLAP